MVEREPAVAREVVGVRMRLDRAHDLHAVARRRREHRLDRVRRVDDGRDAGAFVTHEVGRAAEVVVQELLKHHGAPTLARALAFVPKVAAG